MSEDSLTAEDRRVHAYKARPQAQFHAALAEAQWDPGRDTRATVAGLLAFLGLEDEVRNTSEPARPLRDPRGKPPWLCPPDPGTGTVAREGHTD